jgi:hypothetical protein
VRISGERVRPVKGRLIANGLLALAVVLAVWVVGKELWKQGVRTGREEGEIVSFSPTDLGMEQWLVGEPRLNRAGDLYEVPVLDTNSRQLFTIKVDALSGEPVGRKTGKPEQQAPQSNGAGPGIDSSLARQTVAGLLPSLTLGKSVRKGKRPFTEVPVMLGEVELARLEVDSTTGRVLAAGEKPARAQPETEKEEKRPGGEKLKTVTKRWVVPLGWLGVMIAVISSLYYSWKRSLLSPMRAAEGEARRRAALALRRTLRWHQVFGTLAIAAAFLHAVNSWPKLKLSVSWLAMGMMATIFVSGAFGEVLARSQTVRAHWRRFHVPYTILFFAVLLVHLVLKGKILGD